MHYLLLDGNASRNPGGLVVLLPENEAKSFSLTVFDISGAPAPSPSSGAPEEKPDRLWEGRSDPNVILPHKAAGGVT